MRALVLATSLVGLTGLSSPALASTIFNFPGGTLTGSGFGNSMELTVDGITVVATAWGLTDSSGPEPTWEEAQLGSWMTGLGSCNQNEGTDCASPLHTVDNMGQLDGILFSFSETVEIESALITAWDIDFDTSYWFGSGPFSPLGISIAGLGAPTDDNYSGPDAFLGQTRTVNIAGATSADWLFFGSSVGNADSKGDRMKIKLLSLDRPRIPEPASIALVALGLGALTHRRRRALRKTSPKSALTV